MAPQSRVEVVREKGLLLFMQDAKLEELLRNSKAKDSFKKAIQMFVMGERTDLIRYAPGLPRIKIMRVIMKLLEQFGEEEISNISIEGHSTCSGFSGTLTFGPKAKRVQFNWDCGWKAQQEGLKTWYGAPDQSKAAQIFGYQCFETFQELS